ncbi:amidohydrolase family protein [Vagococcus fluvialis]|nr:amidohydrolase family protein [Vagococcus fluvialis]UDM76410.1 amidohydrolase family protein [Vagococcus fluvialis]UDM83240.1 amidohydrolase family protein [Vagococcus fluvialis]
MFYLLLLIKNIRLETGFNYVNNFVVSTSTEKFDVLVDEGKIVKIEKEIAVAEGMEVVEGNNQLLLPAMREMHIHIDKTYFGGDWQAPRPITKGIFTRFEEESELLPRQLETASQRAHAVVQHYIKNGHRHIRSHCNVDPYIGTKHIELTKEVLSHYEDQLTYEIVAFPQHGLLRSKVYPLMEQAMQMGATHVGGVDPSTVDKHVDKSFSQIFELAVKYNKAVDVHLHNRDTLGEYEFNKLADYTRQTGKEGLVTISHAMALGDLEGDALTNMMTNLSTTGIDVTTTIPIGLHRKTMPVFDLTNNNVQVSLGHDSLIDHWSPFGTGSTIEKMNTLAERFGVSDEYRLSRIWRYATDNVTPLNDLGDQVWPLIGDQANFILVDAETSAHAIARKRDITKTILNGKLAYEATERIEVGE